MGTVHKSVQNQLICDVWAEIYSAFVKSPFDKSLEVLTEEGYEVISLSQNAYIRILLERYSIFSLKSNWVREGILYTPKKKPRIVRHSPIIYYAKEATSAHSNKRDFFLTAEQKESALEDSIELPNNNEIQIFVNNFENNELANWMFGYIAKKYSALLKRHKVEKISIYLANQSYVNEQKQSFVRPIWFAGSKGNSCLIGNFKEIHKDYSLRGIKKKI